MVDIGRNKSILLYNISLCIAVPLCETQTVGLVRYPTTLAPASGTLSVTTQCADNAHRTSSNVTCDSGGMWGGEIPQCRCDSGYHHRVTAKGTQICQGE